MATKFLNITESQKKINKVTASIVFLDRPSRVKAFKFLRLMHRPDLYTAHQWAEEDEKGTQWFWLALKISRKNENSSFMRGVLTGILEAVSNL
jgi:hypothetical protein